MPAAAAKMAAFFSHNSSRAVKPSKVSAFMTTSTRGPLKLLYKIQLHVVAESEYVDCKCTYHIAYRIVKFPAIPSLRARRVTLVMVAVGVFLPLQYS